MTFSICLQELDFKLLYGNVGERPDCCLQTGIGEFSITLLVDAFLMAVLGLCFSPSFALHSSLLAPLLSPKSTAKSLSTIDSTLSLRRKNISSSWKPKMERWILSMLSLWQNALNNLELTACFRSSGSQWRGKEARGWAQQS